MPLKTVLETVKQIFSRDALMSHCPDFTAFMIYDAKLWNSFHWQCDEC